MIHIDLDEQEAQILDDALKSYISDLSSEIADTDQYEFREMLKKRRTVLEKIKQNLHQG